jgi:hypothetical protein
VHSFPKNRCNIKRRRSCLFPLLRVSLFSFSIVIFKTMTANDFSFILYKCFNFRHPSFFRVSHLNINKFVSLNRLTANRAGWLDSEQVYHLPSLYKYGKKAQKFHYNTIMQLFSPISLSKIYIVAKINSIFYRVFLGSMGVSLKGSGYALA